MIESWIDTPRAEGQIEIERPARPEPFRLSDHASRLVAHAPLLVSMVLCALITVEVGRASLTLWGGGGSMMLGTPASGSTAPAARRRPIDVDGIVAAHLFGAVVDDPTAHGDHAPQTTANLTLAGTLAMDDPRRGFAIISDSSKESVYKVGEDVSDGSLNAVYRDHVLLRRLGRLESLFLPRLGGAGGGSVSQAATASRAPASQADAAEEEDAAEKPARSAGDLFRAGVVAPRGELRGFRIYPAGDRRLFDAAGLRGGDLIVAINGTSLEEQDRQTGQKLLNSMKSSSQATITIERAGQRQDVTINAVGPEAR